VISSRSYLSTQHLWAAQHCAEVAARIEAQHAKEGGGRSRFDPEHRAYVLMCLTEAVSFIEAFLNEMFADAADRHPGEALRSVPLESVQALAQRWGETSEGRMGLMKKIRALLVALAVPPPPSNVEPIESVDLLILLRNRIVHFRPKTAIGTDMSELDRQLSKKFPPSVMITTTGNPYFPDRCLGAGCAEWAVRAARALADEICRLGNLKANYKRFSSTAEANK
jgi:hypothetical protein